MQTEESQSLFLKVRQSLPEDHRERLASEAMLATAYLDDGRLEMSKKRSGSLNMWLWSKHRLVVSMMRLESALKTCFKKPTRSGECQWEKTISNISNVKFGGRL